MPIKCEGCPYVSPLGDCVAAGGVCPPDRRVSDLTDHERLDRKKGEVVTQGFGNPPDWPRIPGQRS